VNPLATGLCGQGMPWMVLPVELRLATVVCSANRESFVSSGGTDAPEADGFLSGQPSAVSSQLKKRGFVADS